jgi:hypothetical protein
LVVKNGSKARANTSAPIPAPASDSLTATKSPISPSLALSPGRNERLQASKRKHPPLGMASRALNPTFSSASSNSVGSTVTGQRFSGISTVTSIFSRNT